MAGTFEIYKDSQGEFRFRLKARNGEVLLTSESYTTLAQARQAVRAVRQLAPSASLVEATATDDGGYG